MEDYDTWRDVTDFAVGRCDGTHGRPGEITPSTSITSRTRQESLGSALARVREVLEDDDRRLAATLAGQRDGESLRMREERFARLLDDPEKLRELRQRRAERKARERQQEQQQKGRLLEHANLIWQWPRRRRDPDSPSSSHEGGLWRPWTSVWCLRKLFGRGTFSVQGR